MTSICRNCWDNGVKTYIDGLDKCPRCFTSYAREPERVERKEENNSNNSDEQEHKPWCDNHCFGSETWSYRDGNDVPFDGIG